jgi:hypothetical protein
MKPYHSDEFTCDWEIPYNPAKDVNIIAKKMIEDAEPDDDHSTSSFKSDLKMFFHAAEELKKGNMEWLEYFHAFREAYPIPFNPKDVIKAVELLEASKTKHIVKQLDMSNDEDIKVYQKIIELRNQILQKHNLNLS